MISVLLAGLPGIGKTGCVVRALGRRAFWIVTERGGLHVAKNPAINPSVPGACACTPQLEEETMTRALRKHLSWIAKLSIPDIRAIYCEAGETPAPQPDRARKKLMKRVAASTFGHCQLRKCGKTDDDVCLCECAVCDKACDEHDVYYVTCKHGHVLMYDNPFRACDEKCNCGAALGRARDQAKAKAAWTAKYGSAYRIGGAT